MDLLKRFIPVVIFGGTLGAVVYYYTPPTSWESASIIQILLFFLPLFLLATSLVNLFINNLTRSIILGLGLMFLVLLQSINLLNLVSVVLVVTLTAILIFYFKAPQLPRSLRRSKIPKL